MRKTSFSYPFLVFLIGALDEVEPECWALTVAAGMENHSGMQILWAPLDQNSSQSKVLLMGSE
jgi:hypothetical protein